MVSQDLIQAAIIFVIAFPFLAGLVISFMKKGSAIQGVLMYIAAIAEIAAGIAVAICFFVGGKETITLFENTEIIDYAMIAGEVFLIVLITILSIRHKKYPVIALAVIPTGSVVWMELGILPGMNFIENTHIMLDTLAVIMVLVVTIVGGMICIYSVGYMKGYKKEHPEIPDRTNMFLPLLMVFLGAMCGLVLSQDLIWLCFFWEVTSTISFLLIGYTGTEEAVVNSFRAIWMNLLGGAGIAAAIYWSVFMVGTTDVPTLLAMDPVSLQLPMALLAFAACAKSAQFPFSKWLLGAMCAPTPSSALLHSATMVKAGVYILIRMAPCMTGHISGTMVAYVGGFTFLVASFFAITASDAKKVLAYSTISNLGLMVACCGIGTVETIFAAILLLIFHAVSKSMLFQAVGAVENSLYSRDIEDMGGLIRRLPKLAIVIVIGILGMYVAPFGMLISKWATLKGFIDSQNVVLILIVAFGSGTTLFYWTKFLSKVLSLRRGGKVEDETKPGEYASVFIHAVLVIALCACLIPLVKGVVEPIISELFGTYGGVFPIADLALMTLLLVFIFFIPVWMYFVTKRNNYRKVQSYMAGVNTGTDNEFINSFGDTTEVQIGNWYMEGVFGEDKLFKPAVWVSASYIVIMLVLSAFGGLL